jgi:hypothetical protein
MEQEGSLPCSQEPATDVYPELEESSPHSPPYSSTIPFNITLPSASSLLSGRFFQILLPALLFYTMSATSFLTWSF